MAKTSSTTAASDVSDVANGTDATSQQSRPSQPSDLVAEQLNDPATAAALVSLLKNADLLSILTVGLNEFISRSDVILGNITDGVNELRSSEADSPLKNAPSFAEIGQVTREIAAAGPALRAVLNSSMTDPATIDLLSTVSAAATRGAATARENGTKVGYVRLMKALREDDVQRGVGLMVEIARAIGQSMDTESSS